MWAGNTQKTIQRIWYYPSGLPIEKGYNPDYQQRKYNGKEWIEAHGLDEYDSQARMYYPAIMRTTTIDPLAEKCYSISPYAWCGNNPVKHIDPTGMYIESAWDAFSLVTGAKSLVDNIKQGNVGGAIVDGLGVVADAAALVAPGMPGGAGAGIKAARAGSKAVDAVQTGKAVGKYSNVPNPKNVGAGKATTSTQRKNILNENKRRNNGELRSDGDGRKLNQPTKSIKGQKADMNQAEVDHIKPKSKGGSNDNFNLQVLSKEENLRKGNR